MTNGAFLPTVASVGVFVLSLVLTGWLRRVAIAHRIIDVPNERSSHTVATPRGGGVAIVLSMLAALAMLGWTGWMRWAAVLGLGGGGAIAAAIGFLDDRGHVAARYRIISHFAAAACVLGFAGMPSLTGLGIELGTGVVGHAIASLFIVWMVNLTNFMDGIDGIAGLEAITACVGAILATLFVVGGGNAWIGPLMLAAATGGFLAWNWPPAKIFMGDAGSGFLGLMLAALSLQAGRVANELFWSWIVLVGVFVVDATVTLVRRMLRGEKIYEAHRSHAYQHAASRRGAHRPVTVSVGLINLCWLLPIAALVALRKINPVAGVVIAYAPLVGLAFWLRAGQENGKAA